MTTKLKLAILLCDENLPEVIKGKPNPKFLWTEFFKETPVEPYFFKIIHDEWPTIENFDNFLITGSKFSVLDRAPWMLKLEHFVESKNYIKLIGVCFGHQIIAQSLKGKVEPGRWHVGVHPLQSTQASEDYSYPQSLSVRFNHQDHVCELPPKAIAIYTSAICEYASYVIGDNILSMQYHPEFTEKYHTLLHNNNPGRYPSHIYEEGSKHMAAPSNHDIIRQQMIHFLNNKKN